jgi:hypothetical protein
MRYYRTDDYYKTVHAEAWRTNMKKRCRYCGIEKQPRQMARPFCCLI